MIISLSLWLAEQLSGPDVEPQIKAVLPKPGEERYLEVPWELNLMAARKKSQELKRPLLIWIMDGHVLGCT